MAVLSESEFMAQIKAKVGDDKSDESLKFMEDMTDTYKELNSKQRLETDVSKTDYDKLDASWREKYSKRFFDPVPVTPQTFPDTHKEDEPPTGEETEIADLFTSAKNKGVK